ANESRRTVVDPTNRWTSGTTSSVVHGNAWYESPAILVSEKVPRSLAKKRCYRLELTSVDKRYHNGLEALAECEHQNRAFFRLSRDKFSSALNKHLGAYYRGDCNLSRSSP